MLRLLILADDYTGALDTCVQLAKNGIQTMVSTALTLPDLTDAPTVLAVDTETRHLEPSEAYDRVFRLVKEASDRNIPYIYMKIDSTMRGNPGAELKAALDASRHSALMLIPSFPKAGRTVKGGKLYVNGCLLEETDYAHDLLNPIESSYIPDILAKEMEVRVVQVGEEICDSIFSSLSCQKMTYLFDAQNDRQLRQIALQLSDLNALHLTAGCAGFAEHLSQVLALPREQKPKAISAMIPQCGTLLVCGSVNRVSIAQVQYAREMGYRAFTLAHTPNLQESSLEALQKQMADAFLQTDRIILQSVSELWEVDACKRDPQDVASALGSVAAALIRVCNIRKLIVFGGDTLQSITRALGCNYVRPITEISPGIVINELTDQAERCVVITKAGGFGPNNAVGIIEEFLSSGM